jgi:hypothetical protein
MNKIPILGDCAGLQSLRCDAAKVELVKTSLSVTLCDDIRCDEKCVDVDVENHTRGQMLQNFFCPYLTNVHNKLQCLSLASLHSLVLCSRLSPEPTQVKHLSGAPL